MINGLLLVNKSSGCTSHSVVQSLRRILKQKAIGHAGTLDPLAEGLLVLLLGYGTKLSNYLLMNDKKYRFVFVLGVETDTLDITGKVLKKTPTKDLDLETLKKMIISSVGTLLLPVPVFSAVKVKGKRLYQYKIEGKELETLPQKEMHFYDEKVIDIRKSQQELEVEVELSCSKGSYIRSWVSFIGKQLGTGACLRSLTRLKSDPFCLNKGAVSLAQVEEKLKSAQTLSSDFLSQALGSAFISFSKALPHWKAFCVFKQDQYLVQRGRVPFSLKKGLQEEQKQVNKNQESKNIRIMSYDSSQLLALLELKPFLSPQFLRVFPEGLS